MSQIKQRAIAARDRGLHPVMLGDLSARRIDVQCWCNRCPHHGILPVSMLIASFGPDCPVPEVGARLRCSGCGSKDIATRPNWSSLGIVAQHKGA